MGLSHILFLPKGLLSLNVSPECALVHRHDIETLTNQPTVQIALGKGLSGVLETPPVSRPFTHQKLKLPHI